MAGAGWGGAGRMQTTIAKENSAWVLDCGLDIQFTDGSDYMLRMPVPWFLLLFTRFFQWEKG